MREQLAVLLLLLMRMMRMLVGRYSVSLLIVARCAKLVLMLVEARAPKVAGNI